MDLKLKNNSNLKLPKYFPVEYIESYGSPNINTGYSMTMNNAGGSKIECEIQIIEGNTSKIYNAGPTAANRYFYIKCATNSSFAVLNGGYNTPINVSFEEGAKLNIEQWYNNITINNVNTVGGGSQDNRTAILYILSENSKTRIYKFKCYTGSTLVRDYIPVVSCERNHYGEVCLYDNITETFYYASSTGGFTTPFLTFYDYIRTAYIKDCNNLNNLDVIGNSKNIERIRCNIGNSTGHTSEIYKYAQLSGFNDAGEQQTKPRIVGTFNIDDYYTDAEVAEIRSKIDGITIVTPTASDYNIDILLANDDFAVQTIDEDKPEYNQPVASALVSNNLAHSLASDNTKIFMTKTEAAAITSLPVTLFRGNTNIVSFNEFKYWTGLTTITAGTNTSATTRGAFGGCTALTSIEIPEGVTTIGAYAFYNDSSLNRIVLPSTLTSTGDYSFEGCSSMNGGSVYYNGTLAQWMNIDFNAQSSSARLRASSPTHQKAHLFIQGEELTNLIIPEGITQIKNKTFYNLIYITGDVVVPSSVTQMYNSSFAGCTNITNLSAKYTNVYNDSLANSGDGTGVLEIHDIRGRWNDDIVYRYKKILIYGNTSHTNNIPLFQGTSNIASTVEVIRVKGLCNPGNDYANYIFSPTQTSSYNKFKFFEVMGTYNTQYTRPRLVNKNDAFATTFIAHAGYNGIAGTPTTFAISYSRFNMLYVGDGSSRSNDEAVLALYLADTNWSAYSAKLCTWYDYNGEYKWYYITDNLTNCTNTNPDEWPHITRGEEYRTTIVADEGYTLDTVKVEMYSARDNSLTPDEPTDITSAVYNASTGEIYIQEVVGNVIITASAS